MPPDSVAYHAMANVCGVCDLLLIGSSSSPKEVSAMTALPELKRFPAVVSEHTKNEFGLPEYVITCYRASDVDALLAELGRDAARYKWLREGNGGDISPDMWSCSNHEIDAAIDAMKANT